ncbi:hypothetical protein [Agrobacterium larrymoorei]|uniref:Uncharacterized protein n=1 Tax=Agrobacterium larrymoorei TaxID=160699 RepID=A0ABU0UMC4_9HYPH|nr:hypothetical protein [Agrobacterium larrymoorei]MDQ1185948.1 hypothetical protein [Agrobacterium larrymoorei]
MSYEAWGEPDDSPFEAAMEAGWLNPDDLSKAVVDVMNERDRQWNEEGFTAETDDKYPAGRLARFAQVYLFGVWLRGEGKSAADIKRETRSIWPGSKDLCKPKNDRADLVRAAALIIAEIEGLDRASEKAQQQGEKA